MSLWQGCFDEVTRWLASQNVLIMIVTATAMALQVRKQRVAYLNRGCRTIDLLWVMFNVQFMVIWVYFVVGLQHNSHIVYVQIYQQNYLWTFCLIFNNELF